MLLMFLKHRRYYYKYSEDYCKNKVHLLHNFVVWTFYAIWKLLIWIMEGNKLKKIITITNNLKQYKHIFSQNILGVISQYIKHWNELKITYSQNLNLKRLISAMYLSPAGVIKTLHLSRTDWAEEAVEKTMKSLSKSRNISDRN
jgi:hypothetical protein